MSKFAPIACEKCQTLFDPTPSTVGGRPSKLCPAHRRKSPPRDPAAARARKTARQKSSRHGEVGNRHLNAGLLAAALHAIGDPAKAANIVGIELTPELLADAQADYPDLIAGDPRGTAKLQSTLVNLLCLHALGQLSQVSPRDAGNLALAISRTRDLISGGAQPTWTQINVSLGEPDK